MKYLTASVPKARRGQPRMVNHWDLTPGENVLLEAGPGNHSKSQIWATFHGRDTRSAFLTLGMDNIIMGLDDSGYLIGPQGRLWGVAGPDRNKRHVIDMTPGRGRGGAAVAVLLCALLMPQNAPAAGLPAWLSYVALAGATAADAASSWGKPETNGLLSGPGGRFGGRGLAIKGGLIGATITIELGAARHNRRARRAAELANYAAAAATTAAAVHNWGVK